MELVVFIDEAGTMPTGDCDPPFVVAGLGAPRQSTALEGIDTHRSALVRSCEIRGLHPAAVFVAPTTGWGEQIRENHAERVRMALLTRSIRGANRDFVNARGMPLRNHLWMECVVLAIGLTVLRSLRWSLTPITDVTIKVETKSLSTEQRSYFEYCAGRVGTLLGHALRHPIPEIAAIRGRMAFNPEALKIEWLEKSVLGTDRCGLLAVDQLSRQLVRDLQGRVQPAVLGELSMAADRFAMIDATKLVARAVDPSVVGNWLSWMIPAIEAAGAA